MFALFVPLATVPFSVADVLATEVAGSVEVVGGCVLLARKLTQDPFRVLANCGEAAASKG
jgi:hypothetical protein